MEPASSSKFHYPYLSTSQTEALSEKQRGKLSTTQEEKMRQAACGLLEAIGTKVGFPRKTVATAQSLYHRFHLHFPRKDFQYFDVCLACIYVSAKMHDTLKKPRELLSFAYAFKYPELAAKTKNPSGDIDTDTLDPQMVETDRQRLLAIERLILETICFNFTSRVAFPYVIKLGRSLGVSKDLTKLAWRLAVDCHRTQVPIQYPPHTIALGSLYVAAWLWSFEQTTDPEYVFNSKLVEELRAHGEWERKYQSHCEDLQVIAHSIMDLLIQGSSHASSSNSTSPRTPSSPSSLPSPQPRNMHGSTSPSSVPKSTTFKTDYLIRVKIAMRQYDLPERKSSIPLQIDGTTGGSDAKPSASGGRHEGTVRFLFGPPSIVGEGV